MNDSYFGKTIIYLNWILFLDLFLTKEDLYQNILKTERWREKCEIGEIKIVPKIVSKNQRKPKIELKLYQNAVCLNG